MLPNTFGFMFASVACSLVLGLGIALLLNRKFPGRWLVQTIILLPLMVAPVIAAIMIRWMFNDQFGIVNVILGVFGVPQIAWLTQKWTAFLAILLTDVWLWTPWFALLLLAGLQSLPPEPFEAAQIDAASAWRTFRYITLPMLRPVIVVCIVIRAIDAFRTFDIVWTISGGGPARATEVFSIYAYVEAFQFMNFGRGSAAAVIGGAYHRGVRHAALPHPQPLGGGVQVSAVEALPGWRAATASSMRWRRAAGARSSCSASSPFACCSPFRCSGWC